MGKKKEQLRTFGNEEIENKRTPGTRIPTKQNFVNSIITNFKIPKTLTVSEEKKKKRELGLEELSKKKVLKEKSKEKSKSKSKSK